MLPSACPPPDEIARLTARMLLEVGAVHFNDAEPFVHASGLRAPTYVDCRRLLSFPRVRATLMDFLGGAVLRAAGFEAFDVVAGGETAGIPFAALVAERLGLPMAYVRKKPKGHGRHARIEGIIGAGDRVLLVEDLATDGGSKLAFAAAIREAGGICAHTAVVFAYGTDRAMPARLAAAGLRLHALCTFADVLAEARAAGAFDAATLAGVAAFLADPEGWRARRG